MPRREKPFPRYVPQFVISLGALSVLTAVCVMLTATAYATTPGAWQDNRTGVAIGGYDPLSYFIDKTPTQGKPEYELAWKGVTWRFVNKGNRAAFESHPEFYAPAYSGYDSYSLANGRIVEGSPVVWIMHKRRIYLFQNYAFRKLWLEDPEKFIKQSEKKWPKLSRQMPSLSD